MPIDIKSYAMGRASAGGGSAEPNLQAKEVTVKSGIKTITPDEGYDGLSSVKVTGAKLEFGQEITPDFANASYVDVFPSSGKDGMAFVTINKDPDLIPSNIKKNCTVHGIQGTYEGSGSAEPNLQNKTVTPSNQQQTVQADNGYDGLDTVTVNTDPNLIPSCIKKNVSIFGVQGNYEGSSQANILQENSDTFIPDFSIDPFDDFTTPAGYDGTYKIYVDKDPNHVAENIKSGVSINGITGNYTGSTPSLQNKTVTPSNVQQTVQADSGYTGLGTVTVEATQGGGGITPPSKGFCPTEWNNDGFITKGVLNGFSDIPAYFFDCKNGGSSATNHEFFEKMEELTLDTVPSIIGKEQTSGAQGGYTFQNCYRLALKFPGQSSASSDCVFPSGVTRINQYSFNANKKLTSLDFPSTLDAIEVDAFRSNTQLTTIKFRGTPSAINANAFRSCSNVTTINVPWGEGAVTGAPWGAANATVNYNVVD